MIRAGRVAAIALAAATAAVVLWPGSSTLRGRTTVMFTVWGMPFEDRLFLDRYAREWERLNPGVAVDYRRFGDDLLMKYNAWRTRRRGPEVMRIRITDYHGMAARGMLEPLDGYIADPRTGLSRERLADIPGHLRDLLEIDGAYGRHIYALPQDNAQFGLFYNKAIIDAHNAEHPEARVEYPGAEWTWDDLRRAARLLTRYDESGRITRAGFDVAIWAWPYLTLFAQAGGELWSPDGLTCGIDSDAGVEALEFLRAMQREDRSFRPSLSGYLSGTGPDALFAAGRTALMMDGSWRIPNTESVAPGLEFAVSPLPRGRRAAVISGSVLWGISRDAAHKDEGWAMIRWLTDLPQHLRYWDTLRVAPPASLAAVASPAFRATAGLPRPGGGWEVPPMPPERFRDRAAWLAYANTPLPGTGRPPGFVPVGPYQTELEEEITRMLNEYLNPGKDLPARDAVRGVARHIHTVIDRDRAARGLPPVPRQSPKKQDAPPGGAS